MKYFIQNSLGVDKFSTIYIDENSNNIKYDNKKNYRFIKPVKGNAFKYYLIYIFLLLLVFVFYFNEDKIHKNQNELVAIKSILLTIKKDKKYHFISKKLLNIYESAKSKGIKINSIQLKNSELFMNFEAREKSGIYDLVQNNENSVIENMIFDKKNSRYKIDASFKISRN